MSLNQRNTKKQGDVGLGSAIAFFTSIGAMVAVPLTDSQDYDLVVDIGDKLTKVQVRTCRFKNRCGNFTFALVCKGGKDGRQIKQFDCADFDVFYVLTGDGTRYVISKSEINTKTALTLSKKWHRCIV
jgi:hypothetical protein